MLRVRSSLQLSITDEHGARVLLLLVGVSPLGVSSGAPFHIGTFSMPSKSPFRAVSLLDEASLSLWLGLERSIIAVVILKLSKHMTVLVRLHYYFNVTCLFVEDCILLGMNIFLYHFTVLILLLLAIIKTPHLGAVMLCHFKSQWHSLYMHYIHVLLACYSSNN